MISITFLHLHSLDAFETIIVPFDKLGGFCSSMEKCKFTHITNYNLLWASKRHAFGWLKQIWHIWTVCKISFCTMAFCKSTKNYTSANDNCDENVLVWCEMGNILFIFFLLGSVSPEHFIGINLNGKFKMPTFLKWDTFNRNEKRTNSGCMVIYKKMHRAHSHTNRQTPFFPIFVYSDVKQDRFLFSLWWSTQLLDSMFCS